MAEAYIFIIIIKHCGDVARNMGRTVYRTSTPIKLNIANKKSRELSAETIERRSIICEIVESELVKHCKNGLQISEII